MTRSCGTCEWWENIGCEKGKCRVFPPVADKDIEVDNFSVTRDDDWCGEWRAKDERPKYPGKPVYPCNPMGEGER